MLYHLYQFTQMFGVLPSKSLKCLHRMLARLMLIRIRPYLQIEGWLAPDEAAALYLLSSILEPGSTVVEIGSWKGKSTFCLAKGLRKGGRVIAIDTFDASGEKSSSKLYSQLKGTASLFQQFQDNMVRLKISNRIRALKGPSSEFIGQISKIDLLFIDGDHSVRGCDSDFLNYSPFIVPGGYLALHDFDASRSDLGPTWVIRNRILPSEAYEHIVTFRSLWIARRLDLR